jgi:hypothetical protein
MLVKKTISYLGVDNPNTSKQIQVEICGLKQAVKTAEELISRLDQALAIAELQEEEMSNAGLQKDGEGEDKESGKEEKNESSNQEAQEGN